MQDALVPRFDALLHAMATIPLAEMKPKAVPASSADASEGSGDIQIPKGKSGAISEKP
jgi:hypothetical protein